MTPLEAPLLDRALWKRFAVGLVVLLLAAALVGVLARDPLTRVSAAFMERFGMGGLFFGVLLTDVVPFPPLTHEPLLGFAWLGARGFFEIWAVAGSASFAAGLLGYALGRLVGTRAFVQRQLERAGVSAVMRRKGPLVVAAAALTPIPFAPTTWASGALALPLLPFAAACGVRFVKVGLYLGLIVLGLHVG